MPTKDDIIILPHKSLRLKSAKVTSFNKSIQDIVDKMTTIGLDWEVHHNHEVTIGLAAVQINILKKIVIIRNDFDNKNDKTFSVLVNPEIIKREGKPVYELEGCLSVAGYYGRLKRYPKVTVKALDEQGQPKRITGEGLLARLLQHEIDHTNGKTYIDRLDEQGELYAMNPDGKLTLVDNEEYKKVLEGFGR